ncbi:MAG: hypothetical protein ACRELD_04675 [Longimicrobiales bacterium]
MANSLAAQVPRDTVSLEMLGRQRAAADTVYANERVRELVARAAAVSGELPAELASYAARVETDLALLRSEPDGREVILQLEQVASDVEWEAGLPIVQRLTGYRAQTLGLAPSTLTFFQSPWLVPHLYGDRIDLVHTAAPLRDERGRLLRPRTVHPFAADRERVYRFAGGDTVDVITLPERRIPILRVHVKPRRAPERPALVFEGDIDLEGNSFHIVRMRGRIFAQGVRQTGGMRVLGVAMSGALFIELENAEYDQRYWLPRTQRIEAQAITSLGESRIAFRTISRFTELLANEPVAVAAALLPPDSFPYGRLLSADRATLGGFDAWRLEPGTLSSRVAARDFDAVAPTIFGRPDEPRMTLGARHLAQLIRYNRVEGLFTGAGLTVRPGRVAPDLSVRVHAGWAWAEQQARGGAELAVRRGGWELIARGERQLAHTNDFGYAYDPEPGVAPLLAGDAFDDVDRRIGSLVARQPRGAGFAWRLEAGRAGDRQVERHVERQLLSDDTTRLNRPAAEGDYWLLRATVERNAAAGGAALQPGARLRLHYEAGMGELEWQRMEAGAGIRRTQGRWTLAVRGDIGATLADPPPPQALFELGGLTTLAGYEHKAFTGDLAGLGRALLMYRLPILNAPLRLGMLVVPAIAPSPSVEIAGGWTDASSDARPILDSHGWVTSEGVRATVDLRLRLFGGGVSLGAARPISEAAPWRFVWGLASEL